MDLINEWVSLLFHCCCPIFLSQKLFSCVILLLFVKRSHWGSFFPWREDSKQYLRIKRDFPAASSSLKREFSLIFRHDLRERSKVEVRSEITSERLNYLSRCENLLFRRLTLSIIHSISLTSRCVTFTWCPKKSFIDELFKYFSVDWRERLFSLLPQNAQRNPSTHLTDSNAQRVLSN